MRFILSAPLAALVTIVMFLAMYNQLSPKPFLYATEDGAGKFYLGEIEICDCSVISICGWLPGPQRPDTSNPWSDSEKAAKEAPHHEPGKPSTKVAPQLPLAGREYSCVERAGGPILRMAPPYPEACRKKNAEGVVRFRFDITEEGYTRNIIILESPDTCFNKPMVKWVRKWRYPPCNGKSAFQTGVEQTITFQISD